MEEFEQKALRWRCVIQCLDTPEFVEQFNRLTGRNLGDVSLLPKSTLEAMIDEATGHNPYDTPKQHEDMRAFIDFVDEFVFMRIDWNQIHNRV